MSHTGQKTVLEYALDYHKLGWCVIPVPHGQKAAQIRWGKYQKVRPDEKLLRKWFANNNCNLAVVLGPVSNDLTSRDFDTMTGYEQWASEYPDLAKTLPRVQTSKGMHVYFQAKVDGIKPLTNGELRGKGGYCLLPPSVHPDGPVYQWVNPPHNGNLLVVDPELAGFIPNGTEQLEQTEQTKQNDAICKKSCVVEIDKSIKRIIAETIPRKIRTRNKQVWELIRTLKADRRFVAIDPIQLKPIVRLWQNEAKPYIRTQDFEDTWFDFLYGWERNILPKGEDPMTQIFERVKNTPLPQEAFRFEKPKLRLLVAWCKELQPVSKEQPFWLSARTVARYLHISKTTAWRYLFLLVREKVLDEVEKGESVPGGKATRFRYIPN